MNLWLHYIIAIISGALLVLAFSPFDYWLVAFLSPVVLLLLLQNKTTGTAFRLGIFYGLGLFGAGISWVFNSIFVYGQAPFVAAVIITSLIILATSLFPAIFTGLHAKYQHKAMPTIVYAPLVASLWTALEWVRGWIFTGFPWLQLGYSQLDSPLASIVPVMGVLGGSWLVMFISALVILIIKSRGIKRLVPLMAVIAIVAMLFLLDKVEWTEAYGDRYKVTLVQGNIPQQHKWDPDWLVPTIERYETETFAHWDSDLIVWPEAALPGYLDNFLDGYLQPLYEQAQATNTELILGMLEENNGQTYNTVVKLDTPPQIYRKRHLVPFGEYIPLRKWVNLMGSIVTLPAGDIAVGSEAVMLTMDELNISASICYEDAFGNEMADFFPAANVLLNISNDAWFGESIAPFQHLQIARMRSLELGRPMLRANNTAVTAFIDYRGGVIKQAAQFEVTSITAMVQPRKGSTPYSRWKNSPVLGLILLCILGSFVLLRQKKKQKI